jgi:hypothetical protein
MSTTINPRVQSSDTFIFMASDSMPGVLSRGVDWFHIKWMLNCEAEGVVNRGR